MITKAIIVAPSSLVKVCAGEGIQKRGHRGGDKEEGSQGRGYRRGVTGEGSQKRGHRGGDTEERSQWRGQGLV